MWINRPIGRYFFYKCIAWKGTYSNSNWTFIALNLPHTRGL